MTSDAGGRSSVGRRYLVLDANILIRAILGRRVRQLIDVYAAVVDFYVAEPNYGEACRYLEQLACSRGLEDDIWRAALATCMQVVQIIPGEELDGAREEALARIGHRDPDDWPAVAVALLLDCPIWSEDADFFGCGVPVWSSRTVEIFLAGA